MAYTSNIWLAFSSKCVRDTERLSIDLTMQLRVAVLFMAIFRSVSFLETACIGPVNMACVLLDDS
jgi:hypothetical protein